MFGVSWNLAAEGVGVCLGGRTLGMSLVAGAPPAFLSQKDSQRWARARQVQLPRAGIAVGEGWRQGWALCAGQDVMAKPRVKWVPAPGWYGENSDRPLWLWRKTRDKVSITPCRSHCSASSWLCCPPVLIFWRHEYHYTIISLHCRYHG